MSTALSSTDVKAVVGSWWAEARRSAADVRPLFAFRAGTLRGRARRFALIGLVTIAVITVVAGWAPAYLPNGENSRLDVVVILPSALLGILVIAVVSAAATGGGRELLPREQGVAYPVTVATDHLGALAMAPLNIAWLLQAWTLLGAVAYVVGPHPRLLLSQVAALLWLAAATSIAQVVAWGIEWVRRGPYGLWVVRGVSLVLALISASLVAAHQLVPLLDKSKLTTWVVLALLPRKDHDLLLWAVSTLALVVLLLVAIVLGAIVAGYVAKRQPRDELRLESSVQRPRPQAATEFAALLRTDRVGMWRSVPLRRGLFVLGVMPGAVALAGSLQWEMLTILPGLVASGGALLFGVNSWCLDGRGALWRDSLPVDPKRVFASRAVVLTEVLLFATFITLLLASLRAGVPTAAQLTSVLCAAVVVVLQVVAASLRWSIRRPYAVDMRSSRATPAPPLVMVGYSSRLALSTTMTGMVFAVTAHLGASASMVVALPFLIFSAYRFVQQADAWADPDTRCWVVSAVAS